MLPQFEELADKFFHRKYPHPTLFKFQFILVVTQYFDKRNNFIMILAKGMEESRFICIKL